MAKVFSFLILLSFTVLAEKIPHWDIEAPDFYKMAGLAYDVSTEDIVFRFNNEILPEMRKYPEMAEEMKIAETVFQTLKRKTFRYYIYANFMESHEIHKVELKNGFGKMHAKVFQDFFQYLNFLRQEEVTPDEKELKPSYKPEDQLRIFKNFLVSKYSNYFSSKPYPEDFLATLWNNILEPKSQEGVFSHHKRIRNALIFMGTCAVAIMGAGYYGFVHDAKPPMQRLEEKINKEQPPEVKKISPEEAAKKLGENFGKPAK
jgi:hypothetical protein